MWCYRKLISNKVIVTILFLLTFFYLSNIGVEAEERIQESEINDTFEDATPIRMGVQYYGSISDKDDYKYFSGETDCYKFTFDKDGYFYIDFSSLEYDTNEASVGYDIEVYNGSECQYKTRTCNITTPRFPINKDSEVYIKIISYVIFRDYYPDDIEYSLIVNGVDNSFWESEANDEISTADIISVDEIYYGNIMDKDLANLSIGDVDYYKFEVTKDGFFNIDFDLLSKDDKDKNSTWWIVELYHENTWLYTQDNLLNEFKTPNFPLKKGAIIYIKITSGMINKEYKPLLNEPLFTEYKLEVNMFESAYWEKENNDDKSSANNIDLNHMYKGNLHIKDFYNADVRDSDYYKFEITEDGYFNLQLGIATARDSDKSGDGWHVEVFQDSDCIYTGGAVIKNSKTPNFALKKGSTVYIKVTSESKIKSDTPAYIDYEFKVNFTKSNYWEKEKNDKESEATKIIDNKKYFGNIFGSIEDNSVNREADFYCFTASKAGTVAFEFGKKSLDDINIGKGWFLIAKLIINQVGQ